MSYNVYGCNSGLESIAIILLLSCQVIIGKQQCSRVCALYVSTDVIVLISHIVPYLHRPHSKYCTCSSLIFYYGRIVCVITNCSALWSTLILFQTLIRTLQITLTCNEYRLLLKLLLCGSLYYHCCLQIF